MSVIFNQFLKYPLIKVKLVLTAAFAYLPLSHENHELAALGVK